MSKFRREFKNVVYNYTDAEVKVRDATSNDPWGPSGTVLAEIAEYTFHIQAYALVMGMLWKRLNDHGKNWRHVYKALVVLEYLVKSGSERVVQQCKDNIFSIETLKDFQFLDKDGKDNGNLVREKAKNLVSLLKDEQRLAEERSRGALSRERHTATTGFGSDTARPAAARRSPRTSNTPERSNHPGSVADSSSGAVFTPHIDQSRPSARDEEELQLQLALRMSKEQADEEEKLRKQEEESLKLALEMSKQEGGENNEEQDDSEPPSAEPDLLGLGDPWANTGAELPPSYDVVAKREPWNAPPIAQPTAVPDPFASTDPFAAPLPADPWGGPPSSTSAPIGFTSTAPATSTWTSFSPTTTSMPDPFTALPPITSLSSQGGITATASTTTTGGGVDTAPLSFDLSAFNAPLDTISSTTSSSTKPKVEESFLGTNAGLVNLDTLIAPLPPPSSINPFGLPPPMSTSPQPPRSSNPFETVKPQAPTLDQLKQGSNFDPLPPPLLPTSGAGNTTSTTFNPFS